MQDAYCKINDVLKIVLNESVADHKADIIDLYDAIYKESQLDKNQLVELEQFADVLAHELQEYSKATSLYIKILEIAADRISIYRKLANLCLHALDLISEFNFIENANKQLHHGLSINQRNRVLVFTYIGLLLQNIGRFNQANNAFKLALTKDYALNNQIDIVEYCLLELDWLAHIANSNLLDNGNHQQPLLVISVNLSEMDSLYLFQNYSGPSFLNKANLHVLQRKFNVVLLIICTSFDKLNLEFCNTYKNISEIFKVKCILMPEPLINKLPRPVYGDNIDLPVAHSLASLMQTAVLIIAKQSDAFVINLPLNAQFSNVAVDQLLRKINAGNKLIDISSIELAPESMQAQNADDVPAPLFICNSLIARAAIFRFCSLTMKHIFSCGDILSYNYDVIFDKCHSDFKEFISNKSRFIPASKIKIANPLKIGIPIENIKTIFSLTVWGRRYVENFLNICLPSMFAEGNLGAFPDNSKNLFVLYIQECDVALFYNNKQFKRLQQLIPIIIQYITPHAFSDKYAVLSSTQSDTVQKSRGFDAICFLYSDFLWATGSMKFCLEKIAAGYEGVISPVPPVILEKFRDIFFLETSSFVQKVSDLDGSFNINISPRKLVHYAKKILHPLMRDNILDFKINTANAPYVLWLGPNDDLLIRCFHMHPVLLRVQHDNPEYWVPFEKTLDEWFLPKVYSATDRLYYVDDSDSLAIVSLTEESFAAPYFLEPHHHDAKSIARWAENFASPMHKYSFNYYTIWHEYDIEHKAWRDTIKRSEFTTREVSARLCMPDSVQCIEDFNGYDSRRQRQSRVQTCSEKIDVCQPSIELNAASDNIAVINAVQLTFIQRVKVKIKVITLKILKLVVPTVPVPIKYWCVRILKSRFLIRLKLVNRIYSGYQKHKLNYV